jgi:Ca2+/Na+ antiporter
MVKSSILYVILIIGVLGLLLPAVRKENDFSPFNFLALSPAVMTTLLVLMVAVPIIILLYGIYRRSRSISPI